ncbi:hypothetical protein Bbelb_315290 [Branchiostoma belcheri]|nr:hypothetical protein Bbelb_315290 [Branchiostoma belcheri]
MRCTELSYSVSRASIYPNSPRGRCPAHFPSLSAFPGRPGVQRKPRTRPAQSHVSRADTGSGGKAGVRGVCGRQEWRDELISTKLIFVRVGHNSGRLPKFRCISPRSTVTVISKQIIGWQGRIHWPEECPLATFVPSRTLEAQWAIKATQASLLSLPLALNVILKMWRKQQNEVIDFSPFKLRRSVRAFYEADRDGSQAGLRSPKHAHVDQRS